MTKRIYLGALAALAIAVAGCASTQQAPTTRPSAPHPAQRASHTAAKSFNIEAERRGLKAIEANERALRKQHDPNMQTCIATAQTPAQCKANREYAERERDQAAGERVSERLAQE